MDKLTISITLNGDIENDNYKWEEWYTDAKMIIALLGYEPTHIGISGNISNTGKVMTIKRNDKKIKMSMQNRNKINYMSMYSLPKDYKIASFDYNVLLIRDDGFITLIMNMTDYNPMHENIIIDTLKKYIKTENGEIYEMDRDEVPLLYATKVNPIYMYPSLKILKVFK